MSEALMICETCEIKHYENCPTCFGFGVYVNQKALDGGGFMEYFVPISSEESYTKKFRNHPETCPYCKSTYEGIPQ